MRAQIHQPGKTAHPGHAQVEQDQIDVGAAFEKLHDLLERAGLADFGAGEQAVDRFAQGAAEQRMIVGDQEVMDIRLIQGNAPVTRVEPRERPACYRRLPEAVHRRVSCRERECRDVRRAQPPGFDRAADEYWSRRAFSHGSSPPFALFNGASPTVGDSNSRLH